MITSSTCRLQSRAEHGLLDGERAELLGLNAGERPEEFSDGSSDGADDDRVVHEGPP
jgi:hypothetical protein